MGTNKLTTEEQRRKDAAHTPARDAAQTPARYEPPVLLDTKEAAAYVGRSPRTLERYRVTGGGPIYVKQRRCVVYEKEALDDWLKRGRRRSTSDPGPPPPKA